MGKNVWETLADLGWHADGRIMRGRQVIGYYYKLDRLDDSDLARVRQYWPDAERWRSQAQYAPEIQRPVVFVRSAAERVRKAKAERKAARARIASAGPLLPFRVRLYA
jgi:hypothetical protein